MQITAALMVLVLVPLVASAYGQTNFDVDTVEPCFLNQTHPEHVLQNCNAGDNLAQFVLAPFEWITGGWLGFGVIAVIIGLVFIKYRSIVPTLIAGLLLLPVSLYIFPDTFVGYAIIFAFGSIGILIWFVMTRQSR